MFLIVTYFIFGPLFGQPLASDTAWFKSSEVHDFHISRTEINWDQKSGDIQIATHIFIDDLETALKWLGINGLRIGSTTEKSDADKFISSYIAQKLVCRDGTKSLPFALLGKELSEDKMAIWCYLEIPAQKNLKSLTIENSLLTEIFPDQKNIVDITINGKRKGFSIFDGKKKSETFPF